MSTPDKCSPAEIFSQAWHQCPFQSILSSSRICFPYRCVRTWEVLLAPRQSFISHCLLCAGLLSVFFIAQKAHADTGGAMSLPCFLWCPPVLTNQLIKHSYRKNTGKLAQHGSGQQRVLWVQLDHPKRIFKVQTLSLQVSETGSCQCPGLNFLSTDCGTMNSCLFSLPSCDILQ